MNDRIINRISRNILAYGDPILLTQIVAQVPWARFILPPHLVATLTTVYDAMQKRFPRTRDPSGAMAIVLRIVIFEHGLNLRIGVPADIGGVFLLDADFPFLL
jgi:hypothetical protein